MWEITEGRQAAREVDKFLMGETHLPVPGGVIHPEVNIEIPEFPEEQYA